MKVAPDKHWFYGKLASWALRLHLARELVPYAKANKHSRGEVLELLQWKIGQMLDEAWPEENEDD